MINKNDLRRAISSISISNAKRNTIYKAFSDLDSITKEEFDSVKSDISKVVESMLTKDTVGKANGVASLDSNGNVPIEQLGNIDTTLFLIVRELPITNIKTNKIYLVPNQDGQGNNVYIEYLYVENVWEKLGEFKPEVDITGKADKNETIVEIKRLTGKAGREWNADTDIEMCDDFYQYLLKRGNYCGIYIRCLKSKIVGSTEIQYFTFDRYNTNIEISYYANERAIQFLIRTNDESDYLARVKATDVSETFTAMIVPANFFFSAPDDYLNIAFYDDVNGITYHNEIFSENEEFRKYIIRGFDKAYELPECVQSFGFISYTNSNNYRVKYADGRYTLINTDKNVIIGGKDYNANDVYHAEGFGENGTTFTRGGTLEVNGSATVRDLTTRSITANGSVTINKELNVEKSISTNSTLKAGETTIKGTLHCETHDIKTKSVYPAGTGSSSLKDPSLGAVKGNYIVNKGNLGKPAHNYDKLFVENIYWSDCTDLYDETTSLNGDGLVPIYERKGFYDSPTFYLTEALDADTGQTSFLYYDNENSSFCFETKIASFNEGYDIYSQFCFNNDGTITSNVGSGVRGNGVWYNDDSEDNNIPFYFIKNIDMDENEYGDMVIKNVDSLSFTNNYVSLSATLYREESKGYLFISCNSLYSQEKVRYACIKALNQELYIESKNGTSTSVFATDGSHFDLNKKADLVNGKLKAEQLPKLVNITNASTAEEVVTKFNSLLTDLKAKGYMEADIAK